jgi:hypothetical protein
MDFKTLVDIDGGLMFATVALSFGNFKRTTAKQIKFALIFHVSVYECLMNAHCGPRFCSDCILFGCIFIS